MIRDFPERSCTQLASASRKRRFPSPGLGADLSGLGPNGLGGALGGGFSSSDGEGLGPMGMGSGNGLSGGDFGDGGAARGGPAGASGASGAGPVSPYGHQPSQYGHQPSLNGYAAGAQLNGSNGRHGGGGFAAGYGLGGGAAGGRMLSATLSGAAQGRWNTCSCGAAGTGPHLPPACRRSLHYESSKP